MRQIRLAREKPHVWTALLGDMIADRASQHGVSSLQRIEKAFDSALLDFDLELAVQAPQRSQMRREYDSNHLIVWTSTESTAGRSRTMGLQVSPASGDA